ncbi:lysophospholipid acyltransferase family protein [Hydrogenophaga sp.]|uniref:lysophospholipid acyltransferase family protein n=1 Tax=Hydrogenophaga sp. TaxID=1904254 RepID=UPI00271AEFEF|nr:lysophospholipid acyltransferase family protein [Hydrogenophaga sp.]MDO8903232.1 lysophospholipid acyltransferase family protein [Hydrogenophaga sp.]
MEFFVQSLFRFLSWFPLPVLHGMGWVLGWLSFLTSARYRKRLFAHARQAGFSRSVALASVGESGKLVAELPRLWLGRPVRVGWEGAAHIEAAQAHGAGVLFLTPHLGCFEITAQAYAQRFGVRQPVTVLFRPARQPWLRDLVANARTRPNLVAAPTTLGGVKQLIKAMKSGQAVGLLPDQVPPGGQGVWAPFFGRDAYTMTLSARLAHIAGSQVVLIWGERLSWGRGYLVRVRPFRLPDGEVLATDAVRAAGQINHAMEALIKERPAQYLWSYDRYKVPAGHPPSVSEPASADRPLFTDQPAS